MIPRRSWAWLIFLVVGFPVWPWLYVLILLGTAGISWLAKHGPGWKANGEKP